MPVNKSFKTTLIQTLKKQEKKADIPEKQEKDLSEEELILLTKFKNGEINFEGIQREVAVRAFEKILRDPGSIKIKDWLQSELVKIKKEESQVKIGAMEAFVRKLFSGNLPTHCPHCGGMLFQEGEILNGVTADHPALLPQ